MILRTRLSLVAAVAAVMLVASGCVSSGPERVGGDAAAIPDAAAVPPMGWDSRPALGCGAGSAQIREQADALVDDGLARAGYRYVVIDDCAPGGGAGLAPDPARFPGGIAALADYLHGRGLKLGWTVRAGAASCATISGDRAAVERSARELVDAGVDYVRVDWCSPGADRREQVAMFELWRDGLRRAGRPVVLAITPDFGSGDEAARTDVDWGGVATTTRVATQPAMSWPSVLQVADTAGEFAARVHPQAFNDLGPLAIGQGRLTEAQERSQMSLWAMAASPLMLSTDLRSLSDDERSRATAAAVLAIDQDQRVSAGAPVHDNPAVWSRAVGDKGLVVSLTNRAKTAQRMSVSVTALGLSGGAVSAVDAWTQRHYRVDGGRLTVPVAPGDTALLQIQ